MNQKQKAEEFYAKKTDKNISEFDEYDKFVCLVASEFHQSLEVSDEEIWKEAVNYTKNISKNAFNDSTTFKAGAEWMKSKLS